MLLALDCGTSRLAWLLSSPCSDWETSGISDNFAALSTAVAEGLSQQTSAPAKITELRVSCVIRAEQRRAALLQSIAKHWQLPLILAEPKFSYKGLTSAYADPSQLGSDRWLACLALTQYEAAAVWLVIDAGTAITVDLLVAGQHYGGMIMPGTELMKESFYHKTEIPAPKTAAPAKVAIIQPSGQQWGQDTASCLSLGTKAAASGALARIIANFQQDYPQGQVVFSGGAGADLCAELNAQQAPTPPFTYRSHLVCRGLQLLEQPACRT